MKLSFLATLLLTSVTPTTYAWPTGAGACPGGQAATAGVDSHTRETTTTGLLTEGEYMVKIDGKELMADSPMKIPVGKEVSIELTGANFKGFLLRLSSSSVDAVSTLDALMFPEGDTNIQVSDLCTQAGVSGLTHTANDEKTSVVGSIMVDQADAGLLLDVTVVRSNGGVLSEYFYEGFSLMAEEGGEMMGNADFKAQLDRIESKLDTLLSQSCAGAGGESDGDGATDGDMATSKSSP